jgi:hypothetical protein
VQDALAGVEAADALETSGAPADLLAELALRGIFQRLSGMHPPGHFCRSCHQKRVVEFEEWFCSHVLEKGPHRHVVFSIPKIRRRYFLGACPRPDRGTGIFFPI